MSSELTQLVNEAAQPGDASTIPPDGPAAPMATSPMLTPAGSAIGVQAKPLGKPAGKWLLSINYDPAKGTRDEDFQVRSEDYVRRFNMQLSFKPGRTHEQHQIKEEVKPAVEAIVQVPVFQRNGFLRWRTQTVESMGALKQLMESPEGRRKRLAEQFGIEDADGRGFADSGRSPTALIDANEYVPIMAGPFHKQLYLYDYLLMHSRAFQLINHNALAAAAVKIMQRFVVGRGINFTIKDDGARKVWSEFWERNRLRQKLRIMARDLTWQGELLLRYYEPKKGYMSLRVLDASTCWEVVTDPEDVEEVYYYHFQWPTPYQVWVTGNIPVSKYVVQQVPPTNIQHIKINASAQERRGRSDLLPGMPWLKRYDDFYNGQTVKAMLEANLVWKIKVKGDQADVDAFLSNPAFTELPPPGGMWIENEAVDLTVQSASMTANRGSTGIGQQLASTFAVSMNLPNEYFNIESGAAAARATALVRTDPAVKAIEDRQQLFKEEVLGDMYDRVMACAMMAGRVSRRAVRSEPDVRNGDGDENSADLAAMLPGSRPTRAQLVRLR